MRDQFTPVRVLLAILILATATMFPLDGRTASVAAPEAEPLSQAPAAPTNLALVGFDSTIRATWTPSTSASANNHVISIWNAAGTTLISSKVLGKTANVADMNGLAPDTAYVVKLTAMDSSHNHSTTVQATGYTIAQTLASNVAYWDTFNADQGDGDFDRNYYQLLYPKPFDIDPDMIENFRNERHYHTTSFEPGFGGGRGQALVSRRQFDFTGRTGSLYFTVDNAPHQGTSRGNWWSVMCSPRRMGESLHTNGTALSTGERAYPYSWVVNLRGGSADNGDPMAINRVQIATNTGSNQDPVVGGSTAGIGWINGGQSFVSPLNVRQPWVIKVSQTQIEVFVNGVSAAKSAGFTLPFTTCYPHVIHRSYVPAANEQRPQNLQISHWDELGWDGPSGSINPTMRVYQTSAAISNNCPTYEDGVVACGNHNPGTQQTIPNVDLTGAVSARLTFFARDPWGAESDARDGDRWWDSTAPPGSPPCVVDKVDCLYRRNVTINGNTFTSTPQFSPGRQTLDWFQHTVEVPLSRLNTGSNTVTIGDLPISDSRREVKRIELEITTNVPRVLPNHAAMPMDMLAFTSYEHIVDYNAGATSWTTYLYSAGGASAVNWTAEVKKYTTVPGTSTQVGNWISLASGSASGTATSVAASGTLVPITVNIDPTQLNSALVTDAETTESRLIPGAVALIKITGGVMPVYAHVAVRRLSRNWLATGSFSLAYNPTLIPAYQTQYNVHALPVDRPTPAPAPPNPTPTTAWVAPHTTSVQAGMPVTLSAGNIPAPDDRGLSVGWIKSSGALDASSASYWARADQYCSQFQFAPITASSATCTIPAPLEPGTYYAGLFRGTPTWSTVELARSSSVTVSALTQATHTPTAGATATPTATAGPGPAISIAPNTVAPGASGTVAWSGIASPNASDWWGVFRTTDPDDATQWFNQPWGYTSSCTITAGGSGSASGNCTGIAMDEDPGTTPLAAGTYHLRLYSAGTWTRLATHTFTIGTATVTPTPAPTFTPTATATATPTLTPTTGPTAGMILNPDRITVRWENFTNRSATDWIAIYTTTSPNADPDDWAYVNRWVYANSCAQTAGLAAPPANGFCTLSTADLAPGTYRVRLMRAGWYTDIALSATFTVPIGSGSGNALQMGDLRLLSSQEPEPTPVPTIGIIPDYNRHHHGGH